MKMNFQIANCLHPNSPINTVVFAAFEVPDSKSNLHVAMDRYKSEVEALKTLTWRYSHICNNIKKCNTKLTILNSVGKEFSIRVFLSGDYEFLCHMYGLSGASGGLL